MILPFYGEIAAIPNGWILCDGNNGTPDLRNFFIIGAGDDYELGEAVGERLHQHSQRMHSHTGTSHTHAGPSHVHSVPKHKHGKGTLSTGLPSTPFDVEQYAVSAVTVPHWYHDHTIYGETEDKSAFNTVAGGIGETGAGGTGLTGQSGADETSLVEAIPPSIALYFIMKT